MEILRGSL